MYGKAGWANPRYVGHVVSGPTDVREAADKNGLRVGAGVEQMLNDRFYARAEYRFTSYGHGVDRYQMLAGLGLRF